MATLQCLLTIEARAAFQSNNTVIMPMDMLLKLRNHFEQCIQNVQTYLRANPLGAQPPPSSQQQQQQPLQPAQGPQAAQPQQANTAHQPQQPSVDGFSREALMAGMKPGLRIEDLKQPPLRKKPQTGAATASPANNEPSAKTPLASGSSPANVGPSPAATLPKASAKQTSNNSTSTPQANSAPAKKANHAASKSQTKYPTQNDIMAAVKRDRATSGKPGSTPGPSGIASPGRSASNTITAEGALPAQQRQKDLEAAHIDPMPFLAQAWNNLTSGSASSSAETPKAKTTSVVQSLAYLPDDVSSSRATVQTFAYNRTARWSSQSRF